LNVTKVYGPPGTGKTTFLLNTVEQYLSNGTPAHRIGYFAFTRKAAHEAKSRAFERFDYLQKTDLVFFRTLHSLAYLRLGMSASKLMGPKDYREFADKVGIHISAQAQEETWDVKVDNSILNVIQLSRMRCSDVRLEYNRSGLKVEWYHFLYVYESYIKYKHSKGLMDFTDLLEVFANEEDAIYPELDLLIIDEAQDLSPLQWKIVYRLTEKAKNTYIAGDDDQAIFLWAGADVTSFLSFPGKEKVLDQSYRIPAKVHEIANQIAYRIKYRTDKEYKPRHALGQIHRYSRFEYIDFNADGTWLVLASSTYMLNPVHEHLRSLGLLFERNHIRSISESVIDAVYTWEALRKGRTVNAQEVRNMYKYLDKSLVAHGHRKFTGPEEDLYNMSVLVRDYGLVVTEEELAWYYALTKISSDNVVYIRSALRRGQSLKGTPRISLSTIHGAKGGEADNVVLLTDLTTKFMDEYAERPDNMNRLLYVAVTRTKDQLHIVEPKDTFKGFRI
jgi:superfamily I DNA/RNA helicase